MNLADAKAPPRPSLLLPALFTLAGVLVLLALGVWQWQRLGWKNAIVAQIDSRIHAPARPLPPSAQWAGLASGDHEYERFSAIGVWRPDQTVYIWRSSGKAAGQMAQPGYWVMAPLSLADGSNILVNRGFITQDQRAAFSPKAAAPAGIVTVTGLLRQPETRSVFTPADNPAKGEWYTRDPLAVSAALKLEKPAPFSLDEDAYAAPPGAPAGGATILDIPNNHLSYALTWFGLAATLLGVFAAFAWRQTRAPSLS